MVECFEKEEKNTLYGLCSFCCSYSSWICLFRYFLFLLIVWKHVNRYERMWMCALFWSSKLYTRCIFKDKEKKNHRKAMHMVDTEHFFAAFSICIFRSNSSSKKATIFFFIIIVVVTYFVAIFIMCLFFSILPSMCLHWFSNRKKKHVSDLVSSG